MTWEEQDCRWTFLAFESPTEGQPAQQWFDNLSQEDRDEIKDRLAYLQVTPRADWEEPLFDPLIGEGGISEIRFDPIRCLRGIFYYRVYGIFGAEEDGSYIFLHATNKKSRNDKHGKGIAKRRLRELQTGRAKLHSFDMDKEGPSKETSEKP